MTQLTSYKWWHAQVFLGWHAFFHYLKKLWPWRKRHGLEQFRQNYVSEGAPRFTPEMREIAHKAGHCTTCGACDAVCPLLLNQTEGFIGPMRLVVSGMRGGTLSLAVESSLQALAGKSCQECSLCEISCPEKIPMQKLAYHYLAQAAEIREQAGV